MTQKLLAYHWFRLFLFACVFRTRNQQSDSQFI